MAKIKVSPAATAAILVMIFTGVFISYITFGAQALEKNEMERELKAINLPSNYERTTTKFHPSGISNSASLKITYKVSGATREEVFNTFIKLLELNPDDHVNNPSLNLNGVASPKYKYRYYVNTQPDHYIGTEYDDPCSYPGNDIQERECIRDDPSRGAKAPAKTLELSINSF